MTDVHGRRRWGTCTPFFRSFNTVRFMPRSLERVALISSRTRRWSCGGGGVRECGQPTASVSHRQHRRCVCACASACTLAHPSRSKQQVRSAIRGVQVLQQGVLCRCSDALRDDARSAPSSGAGNSWAAPRTACAPPGAAAPPRPSAACAQSRTPSSRCASRRQRRVFAPQRL